MKYFASLHNEGTLVSKFLDLFKIRRRKTDATEIIPAWFLERMAYDSWSFGLMLTNGKIMHIESINSVSIDASGDIWVDATMHYGKDFWNESMNCFTSPTSRKDVSINLRHVMAAFELADT